jgi:hypothetical protein
MSYFFKNCAPAVIAILSLSLGLNSVQAHLIKAQYGTLNVVEDDIYMVLSLPVSAFSKADINQDGTMTMIKFNQQRTAIIESIKTGIKLSAPEEDFFLDGIMLSPEAPHDSSGRFISQLVVLGKFSVVQLSQPLTFTNNFYGQGMGEQLITITATRQSDKKAFVFELMPLAPAKELRF